MSQPLLRDFRFFFATEEACLPSAVRTDFGKCAIVRFLFAADAAFLTFFFAALLCFVEAIIPLHSLRGHLTIEPMPPCRPLPGRQPAARNWRNNKPVRSLPLRGQ